jgi:murein DD-endopeptidase MepM/ murein hydrolase activator NlpD
VLFVLTLCSGAQADELLQVPGLVAAPPLPSVESFSFEAPKPPGLMRNTGRVMPDVVRWRDGDKPPRSLTAPGSLARTEEKALSTRGQKTGLKDINLLWPVRGRISSGFGWRKRGRSKVIHEGIDIPVPTGTPLRAALSGVVVVARVHNGYGNTLIIDHGDTIKTLYGHCSRFAVQPGEFVEAGQIIAYAGNTGRSTGPHLHFGIIVAGTFRDPVALFDSKPVESEPERLKLVFRP